MALPNPLEAFTWGAGGARRTPEQIARDRAIAAALGKSDYSPVGHWTQGLGRVADALVSGYEEVKADRAEKANASDTQGRIAAMLSGQGASQFPPAPVSGGGSSNIADALNPVPTAHASERERDPSIAGLQIKGGIEETAKALGIDPIDLATAISYETGGTFDPTKAGPTTQWGQHKGFIQFGEPQAKEHGVDWNNPVDSQLGANGAVASYLRKAGVQPGMGLLDIYSAINAGGVGRYNASDANNGGAPGTVADKVNQQMAGHRAKALAMFGGGVAPSAPAPVQVASLDPSIGMPDAGPVPSEYSNMGLTPDAWAAMNAPDGQTAPAIPVQEAPVAAPQQQVAQALLPVTAGGTADALQPGQMPPNAGMNPAIIEALSSPYASDQERAIAGILLKQQMESQDPMRQLEMQKLRRELSAAPERKTTSINGRLVDTQTGQEIAEFPEQVKPTANMQDYEAYAADEKAAGRQPLGRLEYEQAVRRSGATSITNNVGGETLTPGQKKIDEAFADTYLSWNAGGFADSIKQTEQLDEALKILESGENITGAIGLVPDQIAPFINPNGTIAKNNVEEVVQRSLREILGAQFTEKEGERLIARAFNPLLSPQENAKRVRRLFGVIRDMAGAKQQMVDYFDQNGTLRGYKGSRPTASQLESVSREFDTKPAGPVKIDGYTIEQVDD